MADLKRKAAALTAALMLISGCSGASVEELLSPPRLDEEQAELYNALKNYTSGDITLKYPRTGEYRSAFVTANLDGDPENEAVVFYEMNNTPEGSSLRICFLDKQDGRWVSVYDFAALGTEVECVRFAQLGDSINSVLVTYLIQNSADKATSVIQYRNGTPSEIYKGRHVYLDVFDADLDGSDEIFLISAGKESDKSEINVYGSFNGSFALKYSATLSSGLADYRSVVHGSFAGGSEAAIYIDYTLTDGSGGTNALICSHDGLNMLPAVNRMTISRSSNSYTPQMKCMDMDADGIIEIPTTVPFLGYEKTPEAQQVNMTVWYSLAANGGLSERYRTFIGTRGDYIFILPKNWYGRATAAYSVSEGCVTFGRYGSEKERMRDRLLRIYAVASGSAQKFDNNEYIFLGQSKNTGYSFYAQLDTESSIAMTEETLREAFIIL